MRVTFVVGPVNAKAARDILWEGFRRALTKAIVEKRLKEQREAVQKR